MQEEWVLFREFKKSNRYYKKGDILTVSDCGRVKCNGEFHKCSICRGYYYLCGRPLHRIIAEKFLPDYNPNKEVDHKDRNTFNNMVTNLLIVDHKQNMANPLTRQHIKEVQNNPLTIQHKKEALNNPLTIQRKIESSHKKSVLQYTLDNEFINEFISTKEAFRQTKIHQGNIVQCCKNKLKSAGGYIWRYKEE